MKVTKARVLGRDKDRTKTNVDRIVDLCPRALQALKRQLVLRERLKAAGLLHHEKLFCKADGEKITNLQFGYERWKKTLNREGLQRREIGAGGHARGVGYWATPRSALGRLSIRIQRQSADA